jgi:hypothetical protein
MMRTWRRSVAVLTTIVVASAGPALAQPRPTPKQTAAAKALVNKAIDKSAAGDHDAAIDLYRQAFDIFPNSLLLTNIGYELLQSGKAAEALRYFCMYLEKEPTGSNVPYATSQAKLAQMELGNKNVASREVCEAPVPPEPAEPPPAPTVREILEDPPPPAQPAPVAPPPEVPSRGRSKLAYVGLGLGVGGLAALGVGLYEGVQAQNITDQINDERGPNGEYPDNIRDLQARGQAYENRQIGFLIGGGVLIAAGAVLYFVGSSDADETSEPSKAMVRVTPTTNGVAVFGRF